MRKLTGAKFALILGISAFAMNCSGKTYSTFFQPFDLVFGNKGNSATPADPVQLLAATPITNTRLMLTFDEPITLTTAQFVANYSIKAPNGNQLHIISAVRDPNNSSIVFIDTMPQTSGTLYTVTVSNIVGVDGSLLAAGQSTATFTAPNNADQTGPIFASVTAISSSATTSTVEVFFNEAVDKSTSETAASYDIYTDVGCTAGNRNVTGAVRDSSNFGKVTLTAQNLNAGTQYYTCPVKRP